MEFKPGSYKQGDIVSYQGLTWIADRDIAYASAYPKENMYWSRESTVLKFVGDGQTDNFQALQGLINASPGKAFHSLPDGNFYFSKTIEIIGKGIKLIGGANTNFIFAPGVPAFYFARNSEMAYKSKLQDIHIKSQGGSANGINIHTLVDLENVTVRSFGGIGVNTTADVLHNPAHYNASHNLYESVNVIECGSHGFYFQGGDASQSNVSRCDARDNGGIGFYDDSFLGNQFFGCMAHANKGGHYRADNGNNRTTLLGCYGEEDSPPSIFGGQCVVVGGLHGWEIYDNGGKYFYQENNDPWNGAGGYLITTPHVKVIGK